MSEIEITDPKGNKAKFKITDVVITPAPQPEPAPNLWRTIDCNSDQVLDSVQTKLGLTPASL